ncbi:MAG: bifunctional oligoribonuclease/PAP phosphatase NrnA [Brevinematales bacterium]|nr:bifunctional oligoribonuclease/PAP phosphatase NrnA [Brevinematales bacterium]
MIVAEKKISTIDEVAEAIKAEDKFVVTFHINPDYDAVGSSLAFYKILTELGKSNVLVVSDEKKDLFEKNFSFMPMWNEIKEAKDVDNLDLKDYVLVVLDSGEVKRIGKYLKDRVNEFKYVINIDHHHDNELFGSYNLVDFEVVGTGEIVYRIAKYLDVPISKDIASLLYASIVGDSGSFRFDSVKPSTHIMASELLKTGIKPSFFTRNMFQNKSISFIKFEGEVFQNIKSCCNNKVVWVVITDELLKKYGITESETEPLVEDIGRIRDAIVYFTIKEKKEKGIISVALRSKGEFDVSSIAREMGGGGHKNASGIAFDITRGINEVEKMVIDRLIKYL